ncbi:MAG TPA: type III-B CRISPR-associated protein Cas10/Cmr2, partial [Hydrogenobaculum sp.]|nr:type III-B CRISPR-associated protein Cas10/Cmr2 [Hydrogenobaculum sp.]
ENMVKDICIKIEEDIINSLYQKLSTALEKLLKNKDFNKDLLEYHVKNGINVVWAGAILEDDIKKAKEEVDKTLAYIKSSTEPESNLIEGIELLGKDNNLYYEENYIEFLENQENIGYKHLAGAYMCSLCGMRGVLGATVEDPKGKGFWKSIEKSPLLDASERLCGFCLGKRIYEYNKESKFESVVNFALREYSDEAYEKLLALVKKYNVEDIQHVYPEYLEERKDIKEEFENFYKEYGKPNKYYALIMLDGDYMGQKVDEAFESLDEIKKFTNKLSSYGDKFKKILEHQKGKVIYTGGDDLLAISPKSNALGVYKEVCESFDLSTMSGGIVIAHYKLPLNYVLEELRKAESLAKSLGKEGVYIKYVKHSYSSSGAFIKKDMIEDFLRVVDIMKSEDFPNTFVSQLYALLIPYMDNQQNDADLMESLINYLLNKKKFKRKEEFKKLLYESTLFDIKNPKDLIDKLKVAKFLANQGE